MPGAAGPGHLGHMGKVGFCVAEDEEVSPWEPLHVERGFEPGQSVVTVIGSDAPLSISDHRSRTPEDLAWVLAWAAASAWSTNWWPLAEPSVFVICPEHAEMFRAAGWTKQRLREFMFDAVRKPAGELRRGETTPFVARRRPGRAGAQVGIARGDRADRGRRRGRALLCSSWPVHRHGVPDRLPGGGVSVAADYVSPFDERVRAPEPLAPRPASDRGPHASCCSTSRKNRGAEFLDRIETLLRAAGRGHGPQRQGDLLQARRAGPDRRDRRPRRPGGGGPRRLRLVHVVQCVQTSSTWSAGGSRPSASRPRRSPTKPSSRRACSACRPAAMLYIPHPVQLLTDDELAARADASLPRRRSPR